MKMSKKLFIVVLRYSVTIDVLDQYVVTHREYLDKGYARGLLLVSGPQNPRTGGVIMAMAVDRNELWDYLKHDPFYTNSCAEYTIHEFVPIKYAESFEGIIDLINQRS